MFALYSIPAATIMNHPQCVRASNRCWGLKTTFGFLQTKNYLNVLNRVRGGFQMEAPAKKLLL